MKTYPQQHTPWRPDYPMLWLVVESDFIYSDNEGDLTHRERQESILAWSTSVEAIDRAMKS